MGVSDVVDSKKLEDLAVVFARDVLRRKKQGNLDIVGLHGYDPEALSLIKTRMESYFQNENVSVEVRIGEEGYKIEVGPFIIKNWRNIT